MTFTKNKKERVILVGCQFNGNEASFEQSMKELDGLVRSVDGDIVASLTQNRDKVEPSTYLGAGKVAELALLAEEVEADLIVFNDELTTGQVRNVNRETGVTVVDRTQLILDIFAKRANSREGKLQVELAQLSYLLPRLAGQGLALSRQGGGIGSKGPGETQLETDRRHIKRRMTDIERQLKTVVEHRKRYRERRQQNNIIQVALVGYTNAGKSTLLNRLTEADILEQDMLFATLDPTTRQFRLPSGLGVVLSDTVGFIRDLPTSLIAAFRSTLEELAEADLILHVVDSSHQEYEQHQHTVQELINELKVDHIPQLIIYNKEEKRTGAFYPDHSYPSVEMSAYKPEDITLLTEQIERELIKQMLEYQVQVEPSDGKLLSTIKTNTIVKNLEWDEDKNSYSVSGYVMADSPLVSVLRAEEPEQE
ncbi:GTPase HflX [Alkalicoccobacillus murimartini]|uniref:GTPase HflX n=1 Tax=Alkalicoccobacillus murimartini TaxID=171685 RepID=A0ABT9YEJ3_9BACI|nr:GTPase HflX [Alkalicoccobacillus murimartini]MDQ0206255.1 GTP-binding protein HflX [Alkalicoccobacillus murimartini]